MKRWATSRFPFLFPLPAADSRPGEPSSDALPLAGKSPSKGELFLALSVAPDARVAAVEAPRGVTR